MNEIDIKRFAIQIIFSVVISVLIHVFVYPMIINRLLQFQGTQTAQNQFYLTSLSCWFFAFSIAFLFYPDNEIVNSYLLCSLLVLVVIVAREFMQLFFYDALHIPPIIVSVYVMLKKRETINVKIVAITSPILVAWFLLVRIVGLNYLYYELNVLGIVYMIIWPIFNILLARLVSHFK